MKNKHGDTLSCKLTPNYKTIVMGDLQIKKQPKKYDAVIVGSGAGGGMAAYVLANAGLKVCLLEAGYMYDPQKNITQLKNPWDSPRRGASTKLRPFGDFDASYYGWEIEGEPYTKASGTDWAWWRQECWAAEQIIGEEFLFVSAQKISNAEALMDLVMIGRSAMMISNPITIELMN
jgi:choline dehydrogenase-like flavoprotein